METVHSITIGNKRLILRSNGVVALIDGAADHWQEAIPLATSAPGCVILAEGLAEMAEKIRDLRSRGVEPAPEPEDEEEDEDG